jgi:putative transposase
MDSSGDCAGRRAPANRPLIGEGKLSPIVFVTVCTKGREPLLAGESAHCLLVEKWQEADHFSVGKYVVMPDHVHLFASPADPEHTDVRRWIAYWKRLVTLAWPDRRKLPLWQTQAWDRQLRTGESYSQKWDYVQNNPVHHGLVERAEDWPFQGELSVFEWHDA